MSLIGTLNQMNRACDHLRSKKVAHWNWLIPQYVAQVLCKQKTFPCSCLSELLARDQFLELAQSPIYVFSYVSRIETLPEISVKAYLTCLCHEAKGFTFVKSPYL